MIRRFHGRHVWLPAAACLMLLAFALPASAQTGIVKGTVKDAKGQPVEGAKITMILTTGGSPRELTTNKKGEFVQVGVPLGPYKITAEKAGVGSQEQRTQVKMGGAINVDFVLWRWRRRGGAVEGGDGEERGADQGVRRRRRREQGGEHGRSDRQVHRGDDDQSEGRRLLLQPGVRVRAEEGLRQGD